MTKILFAALVLLAAPPIGQACNVKAVWQADLTGDELDPKVTTAATGAAVFEFNYHDNLGAPDATVIVDLKNIKNVTSIDLRAGDREKPGPILFSLYDRSSSRGKLPAQFKTTINEKGLKPGAPNIKTFADVMNAVMEGTAYITVTTKANPGGELRGRISLRKVPVYSADAGAAGHDPLLHAAVQGRKTKKAPKSN